MHSKYIFLLLLLCCFGMTQQSVAQVSSDHIWINEFHYDEQTSRGNPDANEMIELVVANAILDNPVEVAKFDLVLYASGGVGLDENSDTPRGLPYHISSKIFSEDASVHPIANNGIDPLNLNGGWQRCAVVGQNYSILSKPLPSLMDVTAGFAIIYDKEQVIQFLSYEGQFKGCECPEAGAVAGMTSELVDVEEETTLTDPNHSIQLLGTGNKYSDFSWDGLPVINTQSACSANAGQTINDLPCIPPSIDNPGILTSCSGTLILPEITGNFLSGNEAYFDDTQANGGQPLGPTLVGIAPNTTTIYIYDTTGDGCTHEIAVDVEFTNSITIDAPDAASTSNCDALILPAITGSGVTSDATYYTATGGPNGSGTEVAPGTEITSSQNLFAYDADGLCSAELEIAFTVSPTPTINDIASDTHCDQFVLPEITGTGLDGSESYYTEPNGMGTPMTAGQAITTSGTYYIYINKNGCSTEESFAVNIVKTPIIDSPMGTLEGCNELILPDIMGTDLSGNQAYFTMPNGEGDRIVEGTKVTTSQTLYAYDAPEGCAANQQFMVNINAFVPGHAGENQNISSGDDVAPFNVVVAATGDGTFSFQWQKSSDNFTYTDITGATMETYDEGTITDSTYYRRQTTMMTNSNVMCEDEEPRRLLVAVVENDALAVDLLDFSATAKAQQTILVWNTANETNANGYFVEWSTNGQDFVELGFVAAQNAAFANYEYTHAKPAVGRNYYRLRQLDNDGTSEYSNIINVAFQADFTNEINFFPNPSNGAVEVTLPTTYNVEQTILVEVYDVKGQFIQQLNLLNTNKLDLTNLAAGTYQVRLTQGEVQQLGQVIVK